MGLKITEQYGGSYILETFIVQGDTRILGDRTAWVQLESKIISVDKQFATYHHT